MLRLKGDYVPDFRLIDYLVALMSTEQSPALDGTLDNGERLKKDLDELGVFDRRMSLYLPFKLRQYSAMGFSGFEGRHYSLFESLCTDMTQAVNLQALITALAFKYVVEGRCTHAQIPDSPLRESERRQAFFGAAIGLPTFYVHGKSDNTFLLSILKQTKRVRQSHRYPGYLRVQSADYQLALIDTIARDGAELIEVMNLRDTLADLRARIERPREHSAWGKLTNGILRNRHHKSPLNVRAQEFNLAAEHYYREELRDKHLDEALQFLEEDLRDRAPHLEQRHETREALADTLHGKDPLQFLALAREDLKRGNPPREVVRQLIRLMLTLEFLDVPRSVPIPEPSYEPAPVS